MKNLIVFSSLIFFSSLSQAEICGIVGSDGYTAIKINGGGLATQYNKDIRIAIKDLKSMTDSGYCRKGVYKCSIEGSDGYSSVYINGKVAVSFNKNEQYAINAMNALKAANACQLQLSKCSITASDGYTAVNINGNIATPYTKDVILSINRLANLNRNGVCVSGQVIRPQATAPQSTVNVVVSKPTHANSIPQKSPATNSQNLFCWKGYSQGQQDNNLGKCRERARGTQACITNWNIHKQAVYDVCLQQRIVSKVVFCMKGYSQADKIQNLKQCRSQIDQEKQICSTDWNVHKNAVYDVCIME